MSHYIIGTAGHIDHGKTSLTKALTGIDTDRLKEEKERNISIELGFAPFTLPNGQRVSIVDVPGHERFIRHMVSGVGGIDFVLLVIAADEGIMPQTKEHLQILSYLGITHGIVVLTKIDTVDDEWLSFVQEEIRDYLNGTIFEDAPILPVSSKTGAGIEELKLYIQERISSVPSRQVVGPFRMPIDRVFHLKGAGAVVTGTVYSGSVTVGDTLELLPAQLTTRIRQIHIHGEETDAAVAGQRAALNLGGLQLEDIHRGDFVATSKAWVPTDRFDCEIDFSSENDFSLRQRSEVKLIIGTKEILANIILFDRKEVKPGDKLFSQLILKEPTIVNREDRFIVRRPTPPLTIGGGWVIEPLAQKHKINAGTAELIARKAEGSLSEQIKDFLLNTPLLLVTKQTITDAMKSDVEIITSELQSLVSNGDVTLLQTVNEAYYVHRERERSLLSSIIADLNRYHEQFPTRRGANKAELTNRFLRQIPAKLVNVLWDYWGEDSIALSKEDVFLQHFVPTVPEKWSVFAIKLEEAVKGDGLTPKKWTDYCEDNKVSPHIANELLPYFLNEGRLLALDDQHVIHREAFSEAKDKLNTFFHSHNEITMAEAKDLFELSRKYIILLMECFDKEKITLRKGDSRTLINIKKSS